MLHAPHATGCGVAIDCSCWKLFAKALLGFISLTSGVQAITAAASGCGTHPLASRWDSAGCELRLGHARGGSVKGAIHDPTSSARCPACLQGVRQAIAARCIGLPRRPHRLRSAAAAHPHSLCAPLPLCRKGVGWLVASAAASGGQPPMVLPFVHGGMEDVLPKGRSLPKLGERGQGCVTPQPWPNESAPRHPRRSSAAGRAVSTAQGERKGHSFS